MKIYKVAQSIPSGYMPTATTPYVYINRATAPSSSGGKEYIAAVYMYARNSYSVIAWHGSLGSRLRPQFKGSYENGENAMGKAARVIRDKVFDPSKNYTPDPVSDDSYYNSRGVMGVNFIGASDETLAQFFNRGEPNAPQERPQRPRNINQIREDEEQQRRQSIIDERNRARENAARTERERLRKEEERIEKERLEREEREERERLEKELLEMNKEKALSPEYRSQFAEDLEEELELLSKRKFNLKKHGK